MKKVLLASLAFILIGCLMVNGTLASVFHEALSIFANLTHILGDDLGIARTDSRFSVELIPVGETGQLYPAGSATHRVAIRNTGSLDACFRLAFALQYDAETWQHLTVTFDADPAVFRQNGSWRDITIDGTPYRMMVFTSLSVLPAAQQSAAVGVTITMDPSITSAQISRYRSDFLLTQALAIEADAFLTAKNGNPPYFDSPEQALDAALPLQHFNPFLTH